MLVFYARSTHGMDELEKACARAEGRIRENPPAMDLIFEDGVDEDITTSAVHALQQGAAPADVYSRVAELYAMVDEGLPGQLEVALVKAGLHPNTRLGNGRVLLHAKLREAYPPACKGQELDVAGEEQLYLDDLLELGPDPALKNRQGDTALHILVKRTIQKKYFPDLRPSLIFHVGSARDLYGDDDRADYLKHAFPLMLEAGFDPRLPGQAGRSVVDLLREGYLQYSTAVPRIARASRARGASAGHAAMRDALASALRACGEPLPQVSAGAAASRASGTGPVGGPRAAGSPAAGVRMDFGMYKGMRVAEVPLDYVQWMINCTNILRDKRWLLRALVDLGMVRETAQGLQCVW